MRREFVCSLPKLFFVCLVVVWGKGLLLPSFLLAEEENLSDPSNRRMIAARVQTLLEKKCFGCHGAGKELESRFEMRTRQGLLRGGELGLGVVSGKPEESPVYLSVLRSGDLVMPPKKRNQLSPEEIKLLRLWIEAGANWPENVPPEVASTQRETETVVVATIGGQSASWNQRKYKQSDLWAYQPIKQPQIPNVSTNEANFKSPVDAFILEKLQARQIPLAVMADRKTLLRRATYDLTGLPPNAEEIEDFPADDAPGAMERLVDRLLASPRYGEQAARHWFDVVRYADTAGFSNDYERPNAWRYRDYVVRSFNADKPYDEFIREQIAGDEIDPKNPENIIATGMLRMGPWEHTGMSVKAVTRQQYLDDITNSVGVTFLAQALRCAKCHDHKFDPIPTKDYYRMQAIFAPVQFAERELAHQSLENTHEFSLLRLRSQRLLDESQQVKAEIREKRRQALKKWLQERGVRSLKDLPTDKRPPNHLGLTPLEMTLDKVYSKRVAYFSRELNRYEPFALSVYNGPDNNYSSNRPPKGMPKPGERSGKIQDVFVLAGGAIAAPGEKISPGVLSIVNALNPSKQMKSAEITTERHGRRLDLARWITSRENPLTARVIVNRIWQQHFGKGLVATANNFGKTGSRPTHPKLLDWLANELMQSGWSIKRIHRLIMTSAVYGRDSEPPQRKQLDEMDPKNDLLAYYSPRRLTAEEIRDSMLTVSGELSRTMGGPGVFPEIHQEVALQPRHIMGSVAPAYQPSRLPEQRNRRTIYAFRYRTLSDPMLEVFDRPGSETSCERRRHSTIATQALSQFNGQFSHHRSLAMAGRIELLAKDQADCVVQAFELCYGRRPTDNEMKLSLAHLKKMTEHYRLHPAGVIQPLTKVRREMVEELTGDPVQWDESLARQENYISDLRPWEVAPATRGLAELCLVLLNSNEFIYVY